MPRPELYNRFARWETAVRRIDSRYGNTVNGQDNVRKEIFKASKVKVGKKGPDSTSCNANMSIIGYALSSVHAQPVVADSRTGRKWSRHPSLLKKSVGKQLGMGNPLLFTLTPNHYFWVLPVDNNRVQILQGFQGWYDLHEWLRQKRHYIYPNGTFLDLLADLVSSRRSARGVAGAALFGINKQCDYYDDGYIWRCKDWMYDYFGGHRAEIVGIGTVALNAQIAIGIDIDELAG